MPYRKGDTVQFLRPWLIVPLFVEDNDLTLPRCDDEQRRPGEDSSLLPGGGSARALSEPIRDHVGGLLFDRPNDCEMYSVIVGLHLVENNLADAFFDEHVDVGGISSAERDDTTPSPVLGTSWKLIHDKISHDRWLTLVESILRRIHVVSMEHPLSEYAARQVPHLTAQELARVAAEALGVTSLPSSPPLSALAVQKKLRERSEPRLYAVVMDPGEEKTPVHSCVPTAVLELVRTDRETGVAVTALYDVEEDANLTASHLSDTDSVEEREGMMMRRTGRSCGCLRCRFETTTSEDLLGMTGPDATLLGRYYLSKGQLDTAKRLYRHAVEKSPDVADIWHALGAIELSEGHFLNAQRIWKQAAEKQPHACQEHEGISLQLEKIRAYSYLEPPQTGLPSDVTWESPVERAFVATVLDKATCEQVIRWAEQGTWTQQRHYAVPTHDVPVHTVPTLLQWFQNEFMPVACSLLAKQFDSTPNYYVHDAFCVRYEADKASNHLPVHTDESTHSIVLALNDEYDGGGTYFYDHDVTVRLRTGQLLSFRGDRLQHGGEAVNRGRRYIVAVFLYHDDDSQCSAKRRPQGEMIKVFREAKQQRTDFSFDFRVDSQSP